MSLFSPECTPTLVAELDLQESRAEKIEDQLAQSP
jgi:hypothetical protein